MQRNAANAYGRPSCEYAMWNGAARQITAATIPAALLNNFLVKMNINPTVNAPNIADGSLIARADMPNIAEL